MVMVGFGGCPLFDPGSGAVQRGPEVPGSRVDELSVLGASLVRRQRLMERGEAVVTRDEQRHEGRDSADPRRAPGLFGVASAPHAF